MTAMVTNADAGYALGLVTAVCAQVGPGLPGSPQERERAFLFKREMETHLGAENVVVEEFVFAPGGFLSLFPGLFMLLAVLLNVSIGRIPGVSPWLTSSAALVFAIFSPLVFTLEFLLGKEFIDPILKKKQSQNVIGRLRKPGTKTIKRLLIVSGHHDSAPENSCLRLLSAVNRLFTPQGRRGGAEEDARLLFLGVVFYFLSSIFILGFAVMLVMSIIQLAGVITGNVAVVRAGTLGWVLLVFPMLPALLFGWFSIKAGKGGGDVPGAVDNLSGSALAVALCRFLVQNPGYIPEDTEIRFVSFGSEEAGLRGSRRYSARHLDELKRLDARVLNFEMVAHPEIQIMLSEVNGTVKNDPEMVESVVAAAVRAGVPYKVSSASIGAGTDAAPFSQAGLKAATLIPFKVPQQTVAFYHQRWDTPENLTLEPLLNVLKLSIEWVRCGGEKPLTENQITPGELREPAAPFQPGR